MILYHGSYTEVQNPQILFGRKNLDFGPGFYLTKLEQQAEKWAKVVAGRKGPYAKSYLNWYLFDEEAMVAFGYRVKRFDKYDLEWLDYVVDCRKGGTLHQQFDVVEGGVANDNVIDTVEDYEKGYITAEQALGQLRYKNVNHQICILHQGILDKFLRFEGCEIFEPEGD